MGWATITDNLKEGYYRIKIDSGEARRVALVNAANAALITVGQQITVSYEQVQLADIKEAEARQTIKESIDQLVLESDPVAIGLANKVLEILQKQYKDLVSSNQPARRQYQTLKNTQANLLKQLATWTTLQTITYKNAWCSDYTTNGSAGAIVATLDIPGDPTLTIIAPNLRKFRYGDGTISSEKKAAALSRRSTELIEAGRQLAYISAAIDKATAEEVALRPVVKAAQDAYIANPTKANETTFKQKTAELAAKRLEIANLTLSKQLVDATIKRLEQEITYWSGKLAKDVPDPGDGYLQERELLSPAQTFFNAAIFPAWQKWLPTYRWGVASDVDDDANTMTVSLEPAVSTAQGLSVDVAQVLYRVPITYMTCNSNAFFDNDIVVVQFENQRQESPRVIGFLDNPKQCLLRNYIITGYDGIIKQYLGKKIGYLIPEHTAPQVTELTPSSVAYYGEVAVGVFRGWFKTQGTGADSLNPVTTSFTLPSFRALNTDPLSTVGNTVYSAQYYLFPQYITGQYWNLEYLSHDNRTEWTLNAITDPPSPALYTEFWTWVVKGTVTCAQPIRLYFGDTLTGSHLQVGDGLITALSHTGILWTSAEDDSIVQGTLTFYPSAPGGTYPGEQFHPETWLPPDGPIYANNAPRADLADYAPVLTIDTVHGGAIYVLDAALTASTARWRIQSLT